MQILEITNLKKYYGERLIFTIEHLCFYSGDRVGIVGTNGSGKTTLMNIIAGCTAAEAGSIAINGKYSYIRQLEETIDNELICQSSKFIKDTGYKDTMSGGEKTRLKLAAGLQSEAELIIADEPTSNLDMKGICLLEKELIAVKGALLLISHDRELLDKVCNKILEIENGKVTLYNMGYADYCLQRKRQREYAVFEYEQYTKEKARLETAMADKAQRASKMKKTPKRMGNSEARLHKMGNQKAKQNLQNAMNAIKSRIEKLEVKEKPKESKAAVIDINEASRLYSRIIISGEDVNKAFGDKEIFKKASFKIYNNTRTALIGDNGSGKSTLIKMILSGEGGVRTVQNIKVGYFSQNIDILDKEKNIIENVMESSIHDETFVRIILSRLLFKGEDVYKKVGILSGGERVKTAFAKIFLQDINILIMDEPTNYLDIESIEAMEQALLEYDGTLLLVSHDRRFLENIAEHILFIADKKIISYEGTLDQYFKWRAKAACKADNEKERLLLQNKLAEVTGRLSMKNISAEEKQKLEKDFFEISGRIKAL